MADSFVNDTGLRRIWGKIKEALAGKEVTSNKVTSWQSTPDNTHYPSEKLVKDGLNGKANSSDIETAFTFTAEQISALWTNAGGQA